MTRSTRVVPAILTDDPKTLESMIRQAGKFAPYVQVDIMAAILRLGILTP